MSEREAKIKKAISELHTGKHYVIPESDYGKAEIWKINDVYILFEIPQFGGMPMFHKVYSKHRIDEMIAETQSWT